MARGPQTHHRDIDVNWNELPSCFLLILPFYIYIYIGVNKLTIHNISELNMVYNLTSTNHDLEPLHTMAEDRGVVDFHQSDCKKPRIRPLDPSH
jgi:hypothetical protein